MQKQSLTSSLSLYGIGIITALMLHAAAMPAMAKKPPTVIKQPEILGWVEHVTIPKLESKFKAKLDTGATTSSIDADVIDVHEVEDENGKMHSTVVFAVKDENGTARMMERELVRWVRIKRKDGGSIRRPVVTMTLCLAGESITDEINLSSRSHFVYPILIGRNMLEKRRAAVDSRAIHLAGDTDCVVTEDEDAADDDDNDDKK